MPPPPMIGRKFQLSEQRRGENGVISQVTETPTQLARLTRPRPGNDAIVEPKRTSLMKGEVHSELSQF